MVAEFLEGKVVGCEESFSHKKAPGEEDLRDRIRWGITQERVVGHGHKEKKADRDLREDCLVGVIKGQGKRKRYTIQVKKNKDGRCSGRTGEK